MAGCHGPLFFLQSATGLTALSLRWCGLRSVPVHLSSLSRLRALDLSVNNLGAENKEGWEPLGAASGLTELRLERCELQQVPAAVERLTALAVLGLAGNALLGSGGDGVLRPLLQLPSLRSLGLGGCNLPRSLATLAALADAGVSVEL